MAEFCRQCSMEIFNEDFQELAGLSTAEDTANGLYASVICEGCGPIQVDHLGSCVTTDCLCKGHVTPTPGCDCAEENSSSPPHEPFLSNITKNRLDTGVPFPPPAIYGGSDTDEFTDVAIEYSLGTLGFANSLQQEFYQERSRVMKDLFSKIDRSTPIISNAAEHPDGDVLHVIPSGFKDRYLLIQEGPDYTQSVHSYRRDELVSKFPTLDAALPPVQVVLEVSSLHAASFEIPLLIQNKPESGGHFFGTKPVDDDSGDTYILEIDPEKFQLKKSWTPEIWARDGYGSVDSKGTSSTEQCNDTGGSMTAPSIDFAPDPALIESLNLIIERPFGPRTFSESMASRLDDVIATADDPTLFKGD